LGRFRRYNEESGPIETWTTLHHREHNLKFPLSSLCLLEDIPIDEGTKTFHGIKRNNQMMIHPVASQVYRRALASVNSGAILNVASIFDGMGLRGWARRLSDHAERVRTQGVGCGFGADMTAIQTRLNEMGASPPLPVDGVSGPLTKAAVIAFQKSHGIEPDGIVGPITLAALGLEGGGTRVTAFEEGPQQVIVNPWDQPEEPGTATGTRIKEDVTAVKLGSSNIAAVQAKLNALGAKPALAVDGVSGPKTKAAIEAFQSAHGIEPNGILGEATVQALGLTGSEVAPAKRAVPTPSVPRVTPAKPAAVKPSMSMALTGGGTSLTKSPFFVPVAIGGGVGLLALLTKKKKEQYR
jgi:peptidoglycan hydrolase-like protein with peptidoglycan-binding domain